jgi:hypothetical protein
MTATRDTRLDKTPAGLQYVLPGAEQASNATMARRAAGKPLRASVPQLAPGEACSMMARYRAILWMF